MRHKKKFFIVGLLVVVIAVSQCTKTVKPEKDSSDVAINSQSKIHDGKKSLIEEGKQIFRYDAFGDEDFWSGLLHIDKAIAGSANGGFGPGVSPATALAVGLKVDAEALPPSVVAAIKSGSIDLNDPATTLALLKLNAVVGVKGNFDVSGGLQSVGITCASCHSTVDNSFAPGIGKRLDGWPNRDLNVGAIVSLTDNAKPIADMLHVDEPTLRQVLGMWGPGRYPAILFMDGKAFRPDGKIAANLIPAAFGLKGIGLTTYTGWGDISYWNSFVGNLEMHGKGSFSDSRLNDPVKFPIAVENHFYNVVNNPDLITSKLPALKAYQHSIQAPKPPAGYFDKQAAARGKSIFLTKAKCASCHALPLYADNILHTASEIGIDDFEAMRSPTGKYRTMPLGGLFAKAKGGYYHDGRFETLSDVVAHYNNHFKLNLTTKQKQDLVEYLKSL
jgi:mono/diheme cytochrome c family protein